MIRPELPHYDNKDLYKETVYQAYNALMMLYACQKPVPCKLVNVAMGLQPDRVARLHYVLMDLRTTSGIGFVKYSGSLAAGNEVSEEELDRNTYVITPAGSEWVSSHLSNVADIIGEAIHSNEA